MDTELRQYTPRGMFGIGFVLLNYTNGFEGCAEMITVKVPRKHMNVELGQDALLECTFETNEESTDGLNIAWDFAASGRSNSTQVPINTSVLMLVISQVLHSNLYSLPDN